MAVPELPTLIDAIFGLLCGRNPDHSFLAGGEQFPLCQRCAGIYAGAAAAALLDLVFRPRRGRLSVAIESLFILQIAPMGLGLIAGGPFLRTLSGWLFGLGLAGVLRAAAAPAGAAEAGRTPWRTAGWFGCAVPGALLFWTLAAKGQVDFALLASWDLLGIAALLTLAVIGLSRRGSLPGNPWTAGPGPVAR